MQDRREELRLQQIDRCIPNLFNCNTLLYIGAYKNRFHFSNRLKEKAIKVDVLEADRKNIDWLRKQTWLNKVIYGDVRNILDLDIDNLYDVLLWSHGPNMIYHNELNILIPKLDNIAKTIVLLTNWGRGYIYEGNSINLSAFMTTKEGNEFDDFPGYHINTIGNKNTQGNNLLAWRYNV